MEHREDQGALLLRLSASLTASIRLRTGSIFILLLLMGPRKSLGSSLTAVGGFGSVAVIIVATIRWIQGRNESPLPIAEDR
jgi:hypothetical protein